MDYELQIKEKLLNLMCFFPYMLENNICFFQMAWSEKLKAAKRAEKVNYYH